MSKIDKSYHNLLDEILQKGYWYDDPKRKDVNRLEIGSYTFKHDFKDGFPILTTKKINYNNIITELLWFLKGNTNIKYLLDNGCNIWNKDAYSYFWKFRKTDKLSFGEFKDEIVIGNLEYKGNIWTNNENYILGDLGPIYGHQWRNFNGIDQISNLITNLKNQPLATDHIVNSWNVSDLDKMALPPCHYGFQIIVKPLGDAEKYFYNNLNYMKSLDYDEDYKHDYSRFKKYVNKNSIIKYGFELHWQQRSVDTFLGLPYNIASYATLALIIEKLTGYKALGIQGDLKKVHLYDNSINAVKEQLTRDTDKYNKCELKFDNPSYKSSVDWIKLDIDAFLDELYPEYFELKDYESYPHIKVEMLERQ